MAECVQRVARVVALQWDHLREPIPASKVATYTGFSASHTHASLERAAKGGLLTRVEFEQGGRKRVAYEPTEQANALLERELEGAI